MATSYSSQILEGSKNEQKWAQPTNKGKTPALLQPGQTLFKDGNYYWIDGSGKVQKTADLQTAYGALSSVQGYNAGDASQVTTAANQKFNLGGAGIQRDSKTGAYYFKDPVSGKLLTTTNLATAYNILYPKVEPTPGQTTGPGGSTLVPTGGSTTDGSTTDGTPASGLRPTATSPQFYQPVYQEQYKSYTNPGYSLMGDQSGIGALKAMQGQNTAGNAALDLSSLGPQGIGQTANPFSINPSNYRSAYQNAMSQAQPNYGYFGGFNMASPFNYGQQAYSQPTAYSQPSAYPAQQVQSYGTMGGMGSLKSPFGSTGSQGAFGGGFGGTSLYGKK